MASFRNILQQKDFFRLWIGQIISSIGDRFYQFALLSLVLGLNSGTQVGKESARIIFIGMLPAFLLSPLMGWAVDRFARKAILVFSDLMRVALVLLLTIIWYHSRSLVLVYIIVFCMGAMNSLFIPARQAVLPQLIKPHQLVNANALISLVGVIASLIGTMFAGFLSSIFGARLNFILTAIGFTVSAYFCLRIETSTRPSPNHVEGSLTGKWSDVIEGWRCVYESGLVRWIIGLCALFCFVSGFFAISVLEYVVGHLDLTIVQQFTDCMVHLLTHFAPIPPKFDLKVLALGILLGGVGGGMGLGVLTSGQCKHWMHWNGLSLCAILLNGLGMLFLAHVHRYEVAWLFCVWLGWCGAMWMIPLEARLQHEVSDALRGRVFALRSFITTLAFMLAFSLNLSGELLRWLGPDSLIQALGTVMILFASISLWLTRKELKSFWGETLNDFS